MAVQRDAYQKCAYCESKVTHVYPGDVEHILPKAVRPDLVVDWENLAYVCFNCNNSKRDYYNPGLPLIDPYHEDPAQHLEFYGPLCLQRPGDIRGLATVSQLALSRLPLIERRSELIEQLQALVDLALSQEEGPYRDAVRDLALARVTNDSPYAAAGRRFLQDSMGW